MGTRFEFHHSCMDGVGSTRLRGVDRRRPEKLTTMTATEGVPMGEDLPEDRGE